MGFGSKCSISNGQVIYVKKSKLTIADMQLIPLDRVTYVQAHVIVNHMTSSKAKTCKIHINIEIVLTMF